jgi:hypothetical protein
MTSGALSDKYVLRSSSFSGEILCRLRGRSMLL